MELVVVFLLGLLAGGGAVYRKMTVLAMAERARASRLNSQSASSLAGIRAGVWIRQPNGSEHRIQNLLERELVSRGMVLFDLDHRKVGEENIFDSSTEVDVAVIGKIVVRTVEVKRFEYITIPHIHTESGQHFSDLPGEHPDFRHPNGYFVNGTYHWVVQTAIVGNEDVPIDRVYIETDEEYGRRRDREKRSKGLEKTRQYSIDVRFYGPNKEIFGGSAPEELAPGESYLTLVQLVVGDLEAAVRHSLASHALSRVAVELRAPTGVAP